uniref:BAG domain-containing protein n=1 Tax=Leersia perrieri TaxID=77586 RepID=A0A0D9XSC4_9ORYZ
MAGFFGYDPLDYYTSSSYYPYDYGYSSLYNLPHYASAAATPRRRASTFFPADCYAADFAQPPARRRTSNSRPAVSVPVQSVESEQRKVETEAEVRAARSKLAAAVRKREEAAVRLQAAVRGFLARRMARMVREVRKVEKEAEEVERKVEMEAEALRGDARGRIAVGEALMRLLLRLDAVRGAREYRRKVTKRVLALQDAVDALEHAPSPVESPVVVKEEEVGDDRLAAVEMEAAPEVVDDATADVNIEEEEGDDAVEENEMAPESPHRAAEEHGEVESKVKAAESEAVVDAAATETHAAEMEVDADGVAATGGEAEADETAVEQVVGMADQDEDAEEEDEWEMVSAAESASAAVPIHTDAASMDNSAVTVDAAENSPATEAPRQESAGEEVKKEVAGGEGVDAKKMMEMVALLCEQSAQQCAVIGALAERVEVLERAVRRAEEADRRRRRNKKLKKEGKANNNKFIRSCYSD